MKHKFLLGLALISSVAVADCHIRSSVKLTRSRVEIGPTDIQKLVVPDPKGFRCVAQYRVNINDQWRTAEGTGTGRTETEACAQALDVGQGSILLEIEPSRVTAKTDMVCSDLEEIRIRPVRIGEVIWESETDLHRVPEERKYFDYKATQCRLFTERNVKDRNFYTYQGVICRVNSRPDSKWLVVDKY